MLWNLLYSLQWRHNGHDSVSNQQLHDCLLNRSFRRRSKETSKLRVTGLCAGNSPGTCEFPAQMASYAENVSIWWCHHVSDYMITVQNAYINIQCNAGITRSIFSKILTIDTPQLTREGELWGVCCDIISHSLSATVIAVLYLISRYIWPLYNGTWLYHTHIVLLWFLHFAYIYSYKKIHEQNFSKFQ